MMSKLLKIGAAGLIAGSLLMGCGGSEENTAQTDVFKQKQAEAQEKQKQNEEAKAKRESTSNKVYYTSNSSDSKANDTTDNTQQKKTDTGTDTQPQVTPAPQQEDTPTPEPEVTPTPDPEAEEDLNGDKFKSKKNLEAAMQLWVSKDSGNFCYYWETLDSDGSVIYNLVRSNKKDDPEGYKEAVGEKGGKEDDKE
ncbi:MAG: hypothetical protein HUJ54_03570 [Erysipelotrichaceae bacterium]|nr:hypothetical protein [Erysipelotrichaceae bacterium]